MKLLISTLLYFLLGILPHQSFSQEAMPSTSYQAGTVGHSIQTMQSKIQAIEGRIGPHNSFELNQNLQSQKKVLQNQINIFKQAPNPHASVFTIMTDPLHTERISNLNQSLIELTTTESKLKNATTSSAPKKTGVPIKPKTHTNLKKSSSDKFSPLASQQAELQTLISEKKKQIELLEKSKVNAENKRINQINFEIKKIKENIKMLEAAAITEPTQKTGTNVSEASRHLPPKLPTAQQPRPKPTPRPVIRR